jgi:hypothetical protein
MRRLLASTLSLICLIPLAGCGSLRNAAVRSVSVAQPAVRSARLGRANDDPQLIREAPAVRLSRPSSRCSPPSRRTATCCSPPPAASRSTPTPSSRPDALEAGDRDPAAAQALRERARRMYLRARATTALRGLDLLASGPVARRCSKTPPRRPPRFGADDVPLPLLVRGILGAAIASGKDHPELVADLPAVRARCSRTRARRCARTSSRVRFMPRCAAARRAVAGHGRIAGACPSGLQNGRLH